MFARGLRKLVLGARSGALPEARPEDGAFALRQRRFKLRGDARDSLLASGAPQPVEPAAVAVHRVEYRAHLRRALDLGRNLRAPRRELAHEVAQLVVVAAHRFEPVLRVHALFPVNVYSEERLKPHAPLGGALFEHLLHLALPDEGEAVSLELPAALYLVELGQSLALVVHEEARRPVRRCDAALNRTDFVALAQPQRDLGLLRRLAALRAEEQQTALPVHAQPRRRAVAERPAQRVEQVALAAAVRPDNRREARGEYKFVRAAEAFEAFKLKAIYIQRSVPLSSGGRLCGAPPARAAPDSRGGICSTPSRDMRG